MSFLLAASFLIFMTRLNFSSFIHFPGQGLVFPLSIRIFLIYLSVIFAAGTIFSSFRQVYLPLIFRLLTSAIYEYSARACSPLKNTPACFSSLSDGSASSLDDFMMLIIMPFPSRHFTFDIFVITFIPFHYYCTFMLKKPPLFISFILMSQPIFHVPILEYCRIGSQRYAFSFRLT